MIKNSAHKIVTRLFHNSPATRWFCGLENKWNFWFADFLCLIAISHCDVTVLNLFATVLNLPASSVSHACIPSDDRVVKLDENKSHWGHTVNIFTTLTLMIQQSPISGNHQSATGTGRRPRVGLQNNKGLNGTKPLPVNLSYFVKPAECGSGLSGLGSAMPPSSSVPCLPPHSAPIHRAHVVRRCSTPHLTATQAPVRALQLSALSCSCKAISNWHQPHPTHLRP